MSRRVPTAGESRRSFLKRSAAVAPAVALAAAAAPGVARAQFGGNLPVLYPGWNSRNFQSIRQHENDHVAALVQALTPFGSAYPMPDFVNLQQPNKLQFAVTSFVFENTGVGAYLGAAPLLSSPSILATAASILAIEARHSGYLNTLLNHPISINDESFDSALTPQVVAQRVAPYFANSGLPALLASQISTTPSAGNDVRILKFALALEYLEAQYYNLNVPALFG